MSRVLLLLLVGLIGCGADGEGAANGPRNANATLIQDCREPCPGIELDHVAALGSPEDSVLLYWHSVLAAGDSLIAAGRVPARGVIPLYDFQGRQVDVVGRYGGGPGEFRGPRPMPGPGGSLWILDTGNQKLSILGRDGSLIRHFSLYGGPRSVVPLGPDRALLAGFVAGDSTDVAAYGTEASSSVDGGPPRQRWRAAPGVTPAPFHVIDGRGNMLESFGEWPGFGATGFPPASVALSDGMLLTNRSGSYVVEKRNADGDIVQVLERRVDWFRPHNRLSGRGAGPTLSAMRARPDTLWTRIYLPTGRYPDVERGESVGLADVQRMADIVVEVIDLGTPQVVARQRFPDLTLRILAGSDLWYTARQDDTGYVTMDLWRARIAESP